MLNKTLLIAALAFAGVVNLQAINESEKGPTSSSLVFNKKETVSLSNENLDKSNPSNFFSDIIENEDKKVKNLSCDKQEKKETNELACQQKDKEKLNHLASEPKDKDLLKFFACKDCR